jgi:2-keto-4-pentenoate hydratase/2-oxohepta-3-ene-1,7-dioic acid hydratase in catechol pathway
LFYNAIVQDKSMKLVTYSSNESIHCGLLTQAGLIDITSAWDGANPPTSVIEILQRGQDCLERIAGLAESAEVFAPTDSFELLAPVPSPGKIIALAGNFDEHIQEVGLTLGLSDSPRRTTVPRPFIKPSTCILSPNQEIPWPAYSKTIDYEIELGVIIGKRAKCIQPEQALDFVAGYTIVNDVSARSVTFAANRTKRPWDEFFDWLNGKWADGFCPMGPYLLTADEIGDVQNLDMKLTVNGQTRQNANTSQMIFPVRDIVSFLSNIMTLEPGDLIATGTPSGVAAATGDYLKAGDRIDATIEKLGVLTNTLGDKPGQFYEPLA